LESKVRTALVALAALACLGCAFAASGSFLAIALVTSGLVYLIFIGGSAAFGYPRALGQYASLVALIFMGTLFTFAH
jgi:hypothetical protein